MRLESYGLESVDGRALSSTVGQLTVPHVTTMTTRRLPCFHWRLTSTVFDNNRNCTQFGAESNGVLGKAKPTVSGLPMPMRRLPPSQFPYLRRRGSAITPWLFQRLSTAMRGMNDSSVCYQMIPCKICAGEPACWHQWQTFSITSVTSVAEYGQNAYLFIAI